MPILPGNADTVGTALLLAAGAGSRFNAAGEAIPKCLAEVSGAPILARLMDSLRDNGVTRLVIVTGFMADSIRAFAQMHCDGLQLEFVHNPDYATTNNIYSLWLAREAVTEPFMLLESDLVFDSELLAGMCTPDRIAVSALRPWMSGTTVEVDADGRVAAFHLLADGGTPGPCKTVNIYALSLHSWRRVTRRLDEYVAAGNTGCYYEAAFAELVVEGALDLVAVDFPADRWYEIDTVKDQREADRVMAAVGNS